MDLKKLCDGKEKTNSAVIFFYVLKLISFEKLNSNRKVIKKAINLPEEDFQFTALMKLSSRLIFQFCRILFLYKIGEPDA